MNPSSKSTWLPLILSSLVAADAITGKITSAETGAPLPGVKIRLLGGRATATSDTNGIYALSTSDSSIGVRKSHPWIGTPAAGNREAGEFTAEARTASGRTVGRFDSRSGDTKSDFARRTGSRGVYFVTARDRNGAETYRANTVAQTNSVANPISTEQAAQAKAAFRSQALNSLRFTKPGYEVGMKQIDGGGTVDIAMELDSNLLENGNFLNGWVGWKVDQIRPAAAQVSVIDDGPESGSGKALKVNITAIDSTSKYGWQVQAFHPVAIEADKQYSLSYWIKADTVMSIPVVVMQNHDPFEHHTVEMTVRVTPVWKQYDLEFSMAESDSAMRVNFGNMAQKVGQNFYLADVRLSALDGPTITPFLVPSKP